jgi:epsin
MQQRMNSGRRRNTLNSPTSSDHPQRQRPSRRENDDDDDLSRAIEESKRQADEDERKRGAAAGETDDDMAKAIKLSKEEEELRQSRLENQNANLLFDDSWDQPSSQPAQQQQQQQQQPVYQQQQQVDFWGNPIDMNAQQQQQQSTGYLANVYSQLTGFLPQQTGYMQPQQTATNGFTNGFPNTNPYMQSQPQFPQQTGFPQTPIQTNMSNNPYAQPSPEPLQPMPTGSNNPFAQISTPQQSNQQSRFSPSLSVLSEQQQQQQQAQYPSTLSPQNTFNQSNPSFATPPKQQSAHQNKLDFLLSQGNPMGQDTFGNTGELRVPAHYQRTGYVNSAGQGLRPSVTGIPSQQQPNNPFFTGQNMASSSGGQVRPLTQSSTGPAYAQQGQYNQYGQQQNQQPPPTGSLIDF